MSGRVEDAYWGGLRSLRSNLDFMADDPALAADLVSLLVAYGSDWSVDIGPNWPNRQAYMAAVEALYGDMVDAAAGGDMVALYEHRPGLYRALWNAQHVLRRWKGAAMGLAAGVMAPWATVVPEIPGAGGDAKPYVPISSDALWPALALGVLAIIIIKRRA